jgi:hypothetical protein
MATLFTSFGHGLLFWIRGLEYGEKIVPLILYAKEKAFV